MADDDNTLGDRPATQTAAVPGAERRSNVVSLVYSDGARLDNLPPKEGGPRGPGGGGGGGKPEQPPVANSDDALANILADRITGDWHYVGRWGDWLHWNGQRWEVDERLAIVGPARAVCREAGVALGANSMARGVSSAKTIQNVVSLARSDPGIAATPENFDADPWLLNTPGGHVDLRSGQLLPHDAARLCTKIAGAAPFGECPTWRAFLRDVTDGDRDLEDYLQRLVGYSLIGICDEEVFIFIYGRSNTGKSKFVEALRLVHHLYGDGAPMDTFTATKMERHPTDLADFQGKRLITAAETEEGRRWDQQRITMLTGRDRIKARRMRTDFFEFFPQFLLVFHGNYRPRLGNADEAMRRRMHLVPFTHRPARIDPHLIDKIRAELGGVVQWAIEGALLWQRLGLNPPRLVKEATDSYFQLENSLAQWVDERCDRAPELMARTRELYSDFARWLQSSGEFVPTEKVFVSKLEAYSGLVRARLPGDRMGFRGIALKHRQEVFDV